MGLQDYTYRLKAQSGDSTPHDELGNTSPLSGGTITLVDRGSGDYAWQFVGQATTIGPTTAVSAVNSGVTIAARYAVTAYGAGDFNDFWSYRITGGPSQVGALMYKYGNNVHRGRYDAIDAGLTITGIGTAIRTVVLRVRTGPSDTDDYSEVWIDRTDRTGTDPDRASSAQNFNARTLVNLYVGNSTDTLQVSDWVIWPEVLTNEQCAALADDGIREVLDAGPSGPTINTHPSNQSKTEGETATFNVSATSSGGTLAYQWQVDDGGGWDNVSTGSGGTTNAYTTATLTLAEDGYQYRCVVTDENGSVNSSAATLEVTEAEGALLAAMMQHGQFSGGLL